MSTVNSNEKGAGRNICDALKRREYIYISEQSTSKYTTWKIMSRCGDNINMDREEMDF